MCISRHDLLKKVPLHVLILSFHPASTCRLLLPDASRRRRTQRRRAACLRPAEDGDHGTKGEAHWPCSGEGHVQASEDETSEALCKVANAKCSVDAAAEVAFTCEAELCGKLRRGEGREEVVAMQVLKSVA